MAIPNEPTYGDIPPEVLRYLQMPGVNQQKALEWFSLGLSEPQTFNQARLLAEAVGYSPEQAKVVAGQWQFESAGGARVPANFNYFGIKAHDERVRGKLSERGITVGVGDEAQTAKGKATFMQFSNAFEGFAAHKAFLETNSRYENALKAETAKDFALGIGAAGYADESYGTTLYNEYVLPKEKKPETGDTRPKSLGTPKSSANAQKEAEKLTAGIPQENLPKLSPKPVNELPTLPSITIPTEPTRRQAQEGAVAYEQKPAEYDPVEFSAPKGFFGSGQTMFAGGGHLNFKSPAAYKAWLAYGHASGEFAKTPGHQKVAIKGKAHKVQHGDGGGLDDPQPSAKGFALFPSLYGQVDWATRNSLPEGVQSLGSRNWIESMKVAHNINKRIRNKEVGYTADGTPIDYSQYAKVSPRFFYSKDNTESIKFEDGGTMNTTDPTNPPKRKSIPAIHNYRFTPPADYNKYLKERQAEWSAVYDPSTGRMLQGADDASGGGMRKATADEIANRMAEIEAMPQRDLLQSHLEEYEALKAGLYFKRGDANDPTGSAGYASFYPTMDLRKTYPAPAPPPAATGPTLPTLPPIEEELVPIEPEPEYAFRDVTQILRDDQGNYVNHRTLSADKVKEMYKQGINDPAIAPYWTSEYNAPGGERVAGNQGTFFNIPRTMNVNQFAAGGKMGDPPPTNMDPYLMYQQNLLSELKGLKNSPINPKDFMVSLPTLPATSRTVPKQRSEDVPPYITELNSIPYSNYRDTQVLMQEFNNYKAKQAEAENYFRSYAAGGPMDQLTQFTEGGTHEENPIGGIPQGMSPDGRINLVEEGETKHNSEDYIFSDSLKIDKSIAKEFNLTAGMIGKTFAEASEKANRPNSRRENDSIEQKAIKRDLDNLMAAQEAFKAKEIENKVMELQSLAPEIFAAPQGGLPPMTPEMNTFMCGGKKYEFGGNIKNPELMTKIGRGFQAASPFLNVIPGVGQVASLAAAGIGTGLTMAGNAGMEYQNKLAAETEAAKMQGLAADQAMGIPVVNRYGGNIYNLGGPLEDEIIPPVATPKAVTPFTPVSNFDPYGNPLQQNNGLNQSTLLPEGYTLGQLEKENPTPPADHYNVNTDLGSTAQDLRTHSSLVGSLSGLAGTAYNLYQGIKKPNYIRPEELYKEVEFQRPDYTQAEVAARQDYASMLRSMGQSGISGGSGILNKLAAAEQMKQRTNEIMSAEENAARQLENEAAKMNAMQFAEAKKTSLDANWRMDAARQESIKQAIQDFQNREATNVANKLAQSYVAMAAPDLVGEGKIQVGHQSYPEWLRNKYLRGKK